MFLFQQGIIKFNYRIKKLISNSSVSYNKKKEYKEEDEKKAWNDFFTTQLSSKTIFGGGFKKIDLDKISDNFSKNNQTNNHTNNKEFKENLERINNRKKELVSLSVDNIHYGLNSNNISYNNLHNFHFLISNINCPHNGGFKHCHNEFDRSYNTLLSITELNKEFLKVDTRNQNEERKKYARENLDNLINDVNNYSKEKLKKLDGKINNYSFLCYNKQTRKLSNNVSNNDSNRIFFQKDSNISEFKIPNVLRLNAGKQSLDIKKLKNGIKSCKNMVDMVNILENCNSISKKYLFLLIRHNISSILTKKQNDSESETLLNNLIKFQSALLVFSCLISIGKEITLTNANNQNEKKPKLTDYIIKNCLYTMKNFNENLKKFTDKDSKDLKNLFEYSKQYYEYYDKEANTKKQR